MNKPYKPENETESNITRLRQYFDEVAWKTENDGTWTDTRLEVSPTRLNDRYAAKEHMRNRKNLKGSGNHFLDAGSGARPYSVYSKGYRRHVCVDFSFTGLEGASKTLGAGGFCVCADIRYLPFRSGVFDGFCCPYVIYHIAGEDNQQLALSELHRVLAAGSSGVVIYDNPRHIWTRLTSWLAHRPRLRAFLSRVGGGGRPPDREKIRPEAVKAREELLHYEPLSASDLKEAIGDKDSMTFKTHSFLTEPQKKAWLRDNFAWKTIVHLLLFLEAVAGDLLWPLAPVWCIVVRKRPST